MADLEKDFFAEEESIQIDFGKYWKRIRNHWKTVLWFAAGGFVLGCIIAIGTPRKFVVTSKLAPELSSTATNRLSSVASMMGFSSTMFGTTDAVYPMVYPDIVHSPDFVADLFDTPVQCKVKKEIKDTTLYGYLTDLSGGNVVAKVIGFPLSIPGRIKGLFEPKMEDDEPGVAVPVDPFHFTRKQGRIYKMLCKCIKAEIDKKTLVVTITVQMSDAQICATLAEAVNENLRKYIIRYRTEKSVSERDYYATLYEKAQQEYYEAQRIYSRYMDTHQSMAFLSVQTERERLRNEAQIKYQLYSTSAQQLQNAEAKVMQETPVFAEILKPTVPLKSANSRKKTALAFAFLGLCAGAVWVLWKGRKETENS